MTTQIKFTTAEEAVKVIKSGDHIHLSSVASAPQCLINAMCARGEAGELKDVHIHHLHTEGPAPYADEKFEGVFQLDSFFVGGNVRKVTQSGSDTIVQIDRDGTGGNFATANVVTLTGVHTDLATLLANHQLMVV